MTYLAYTSINDEDSVCFVIYPIRLLLTYEHGKHDHTASDGRVDAARFAMPLLRGYFRHKKLQHDKCPGIIIFQVENYLQYF